MIYQIFQNIQTIRKIKTGTIINIFWQYINKAQKNHAFTRCKLVHICFVTHTLLCLVGTISWRVCVCVHKFSLNLFGASLSLRLKFHKNLSFCRWDIRKIMLMFVYYLIINVLCTCSKFEKQTSVQRTCIRFCCGYTSANVGQ